jgi:hypothetical protein
MVVIVFGAGNHSNRLFQAIHLEAFCLERGLRFWNPTFHDIARLYGLKRGPFDALACLLAKALRKLRVFKPLAFSDFGSMAEYESALLRGGVAFVEGWCFREDDLVRKHRDELIRKYRLLPRYYEGEATYRRFSALDRSERIVVGVHIRRGDYETWNGGKYYFEDDAYERYMLLMATNIKRELGRKAFFVVFSNERITLRESEDVMISESPWYVEQHMMSECDFLIGPPSTFTLWASFIGRVKYFHIQDASGEVELSDFKRCEG